LVHGDHPNACDPATNQTGYASGKIFRRSDRSVSRPTPVDVRYDNQAADDARIDLADPTIIGAPEEVDKVWEARSVTCCNGPWSSELIADRRYPWKFAFFLEQALGHVVHAMNIAQILEVEPGIDAQLFPIAPHVPMSPVHSPDKRPLPVVGNWSVQASLATRKQFRTVVRAGRPDAAFIHTQVAALFCNDLMRRVPTVVSLDATPMNFDSMADAYRHKVRSGSVEAVKRAFNRRALLAARAVVTWSHWAAASVTSDYNVPAERVRVVPPGVDLKRFHPSDREREPGPVRLLFVGGDFVRKGGPDLLEAMEALGSSVELDVVSSSAQVPTGLPVRVHANISGNSPALAELYRRADVFVLPSRGDCLSIAVAEAMASGLPVVATPVGAVSEMLVDGDNGLAVATRDPRQLADAVATLVSEPALRRAMGTRSRAIAEADHDVSRNTRTILALMREISAKSTL
jgi:glycosyltransferase involved in cell wall biosynthesis